MSSPYQKLKQSISRGVVKQIVPRIAAQSTQLSPDTPSPATPTTPMLASFTTDSDGSSIKTADASATGNDLTVLASVEDLDPSVRRAMSDLAEVGPDTCRHSSSLLANTSAAELASTGLWPRTVRRSPPLDSRLHHTTSPMKRLLCCLAVGLPNRTVPQVNATSARV
ncbi:uncharacterized protein PHACADRAFT_255187 [Phanerochaete carnosa HHB-10118-sp]|uniref:Uncharacterized protein n=1 Tax=Phanerochaete carnosa (strain HHB-10118-sp) TaxID=650164 RepID=K5W7K5_PHACS|nr:uncharacterized protein PHACADRAFT_255187 [Phanerochaete carnosa HHB-10118-sp]EKM54949.1 hypothetical protein PHACADRAFT_255187 [Phanerochaete carnosa HHB-10118-sp]